MTCQVRSGWQGRLHVFVCCSSSLTGDLPSAVWPAGLETQCVLMEPQFVQLGHQKPCLALHIGDLTYRAQVPGSATPDIPITTRVVLTGQLNVIRDF